MRTAKRDYYAVLGVSRDADEKAIRSEFRKLAFQYHPDRNKEPGAEERFKEIAEAYAVLSDPNKRAAYDAGRLSTLDGFSLEDLFGGVDFADLGFGFGGDSLFGPLFRQRARAPVRGANVEVDLAIPLERVVTGGEETTRVAYPRTCSACAGSGAKAGTTPRTCGSCGGTGRRVATQTGGAVTVRQVSTCSACQGRGSVIDEVCPECDGEGRVEQPESVAVKIPVGVEEGMALRVAGRGLPSPAPGGVPGDLFVLVRTLPDPRFERRGADLWRIETLEFPDAALGAVLRVPTLAREVSLVIPPGTQTGSVFRLEGAGLPELGRIGRGNLWVQVVVHTPEDLSPQERALYERLREIGSGATPGFTSVAVEAAPLAAAQEPLVTGRTTGSEGNDAAGS